MDWIRLGTSGIDLSGTKGAIIKVTYSELQKHNTRDDAWLAIRGKVFNVTHYMDFHPGGIDELMKGVGRDATKIFDDVHAWVNYEQLLGKCYVGPLRNIGLTTITEHKTPNPSTSRLSPNLNEKFKFPSFKLSNSSPDISIDNNKSPEHNEIIPRFDWIQKTSDLTLIFYTKSLCNPGLIIEYLSDNEISIRIIIERIVHLCKFKFSHNLLWPCNFKLFYESGKIEIFFIKSIPILWTNFGTLDRKKLTEFEEYEKVYDVVECQSITNDSYSVILAPKQKIIQIYPIGYHTTISAKVRGNDIARSYTPVPNEYLSSTKCTKTSIGFLIKSYKAGIFSKHITHFNSLTNSFMLSQPKGSFSLQKLKNHNRIGLLAAGSGITPMLSILDYLLQRTSNKMQSIIFLLFNKDESDIWCRNVLEKLSLQDNRLKLRYILSQPHEQWTGEKGRISTDIVLTLSNKDSSDYVSFSCICGPTTFNDLTIKLLRENGYNSNTIHCFQG